MPWTQHARAALLAAYKAALDEGVSGGAAGELAVRRYRVYFPTISEAEARRALVHAIASDGPAACTVGAAPVHDRGLEIRNAPAFRMKAEDLNTVADGAVSAVARQALRDLGRTYDRPADRDDTRIEPGAGAKASEAG